MIKIENKEIIKGQGLLSGVILTPDEFAEANDACEEMIRQAREAEAASKETDERLEALSNEKSDKEASLAALKADLEDLRDMKMYLNNLLDQEKRLNEALLKAKEDGK